MALSSDYLTWLGLPEVNSSDLVMEAWGSEHEGEMKAPSVTLARHRAGLKQGGDMEPRTDVHSAKLGPGKC